MSAKFTPGRWERIGNKVFALTPNDRQEPGWPPEINRFGCYVQRENREPCGAPDDELEANARLIAAAPDLYAALREVLDDWEAGHKATETPSFQRALNAYQSAAQ